MGYKQLRRIHALCRFAVFMVACSVLTLHARTDILDRVLAVVGSDVIMLSDVRTVTTFGLMPDAHNEADVLTQLIDRALILGEVNRFIVPEPGVGVIEARLDDLRSRFPTPEAFLDALAKNKIYTEAHIYPTGGHGYSMGIGNAQLSSWPGLFVTWVKTLL